jgi:hypothetical protein
VVAPRKAPMDRLKPAAAAAPPEPSSFVEIVSGGVERTEETLFAIDGVRFNITVPVQAGLTLQAIDKMTEVGESGAMMWLLRQLIGAHAYTALSTHPDVTAEHLVIILARLQEITMGELEDAQGKG